MVIIKKKDFEIERKGGRIGILAAGTSDIAVADTTTRKPMPIDGSNLDARIEVNPTNPSGLDSPAVLIAIGWAAGEWDSGKYSQSLGETWYGVTPDLFKDTIETTTTKTYDDLAWTSDKLDKHNILIWGDYPTSGVIAVTIMWYNVATRTVVEFDIVFEISVE
jgi:hypothetical protein